MTFSMSRLHDTIRIFIECIFLALCQVLGRGSSGTGLNARRRAIFDFLFVCLYLSVIKWNNLNSSLV